MATTGVLLVNLGTPDSPSVADVRKYLREFLMDRRVIDIPLITRFLLVNLIIAPFRGPKSAKVYKQLWTEKGSPLKFYGHEVEGLLQEALGADHKVILAMRYQNPSIKVALDQFKNSGIHKIVVLPMFPQYASASTGSVHEAVMNELKTWELIPEVNFIDAYSTDSDFINAFTTVGKRYLHAKNYDHYVFTYHGLPERQITKSDCTGKCIIDKNCCDTLHDHNRLCYRAQCFATTRELVKSLEIPEGKYTVSFQSRLLKDPWIKPYTDDIIKELAASGKKNILAFVPSFVADCLETTIEVGDEYKELFEEHGGEHWDMVPSLNAEPSWVNALKNMVLKYA
jgi:ferrochelatase